MLHYGPSPHRSADECFQQQAGSHKVPAPAPAFAHVPPTVPSWRDEFRGLREERLRTQTAEERELIWRLNGLPQDRPSSFSTLIALGQLAYLYPYACRCRHPRCLLAPHTGVCFPPHRAGSPTLDGRQSPGISICCGISSQPSKQICSPHRLHRTSRSCCESPALSMASVPVILFSRTSHATASASPLYSIRSRKP